MIGSSGRVGRVSALLTAVALFAGGCGAVDGGLRGIPLPGGANLGDDPYSVQIEFADVVDLVPQSIVRVGDVPVGAVEKVAVEPGSWNALVTVSVNRDVKLPANATARVRTTSLLGEKFVELSPPTVPAEGDLAQSGKIGLQASGRAAEVEEVLGALSLLLNGGGVAQIRTISTELNNALSGREPQIRGLLDNLDRLVGSLDSSRTTSTGHSTGSTACRPRSPSVGRRSRTPCRTSAPACANSRPSAPSWSACCRRSTGCPASRRTSSTGPATTCSPTWRRCARCCGTWPTPARTCRTRCSCCCRSRSPTRPPTPSPATTPTCTPRST